MQNYFLSSLPFLPPPFESFPVAWLLLPLLLAPLPLPPPVPHEFPGAAPREEQSGATHGWKTKVARVCAHLSALAYLSAPTTLPSTQPQAGRAGAQETKGQSLRPLYGVSYFLRVCPIWEKNLKNSECMYMYK